MKDPCCSMVTGQEVDLAWCANILLSSWDFPGRCELDKGAEEGRLRSQLSKMLPKRKGKMFLYMSQNMLKASLPRSHPQSTQMQLKVTKFTTFSLLTLLIGFVWIREVRILGKGASSMRCHCSPFSMSVSFGETSRTASLAYDKFSERQNR